MNGKIELDLVQFSTFFSKDIEIWFSERSILFSNFNNIANKD